MNLELIKKKMHSQITRTLTTDRTKYDLFNKIFQKSLFGSSNFSCLATQMLQNKIEVTPELKFPYWMFVISRSGSLEKKGINIKKVEIEMTQVINLANETNDNPLDSTLLFTEKVT